MAQTPKAGLNPPSYAIPIDEGSPRPPSYAISVGQNPPPLPGEPGGPSTLIGPMQRFTSSALQSMGLPSLEAPISAWNPIPGLEQIAAHPLDSAELLLKAIATGQTNPAVRAYKLAQQPGIAPKIEAAGEALASVIPMIGPTAARAGEQIGKGDVAGGLGTLAPLVALSPEARALGGDVAARAGEATESAANRALLMGRRPEEAVVNALNRGRISKVGLTSPDVAQVLPDIKRVMPEVRGLSPKVPPEMNFLDAVKTAKEDVWGRYLRQIGRHAQDTIEGGKYIADPMVDAIPNKIKFEHPEVVDEVKELADKYRKPMSLKELEDFRREATARQGSFFRKGARAQYEAGASNLDTAVHNAQASGFRNAIDDILQRHEMEGVPGKALRQKFGILRRMQEAAEKQQLNLGAKSPIDIWRGLGTLGAAGDVAGSLLTGHPVGALGGAAYLGAGELMRALNNPDFMLRRAMEPIEPNIYPPEGVPRPRPMLTTGEEPLPAEFLGRGRGPGPRQGPLYQPPSPLSPVAGSEPTPLGGARGYTTQPQPEFPITPYESIRVTRGEFPKTAAEEMAQRALPEARIEPPPEPLRPVYKEGEIIGYRRGTEFVPAKPLREPWVPSIVTPIILEELIRQMAAQRPTRGESRHIILSDGHRLPVSSERGAEKFFRDIQRAIPHPIRRP